SRSILCCNTRKYHGLFVCQTPKGRCVLLSAIEESMLGENREFLFSTRQHPLQLYPAGYEFQECYLQEHWPVFKYRMGNSYITRELLLTQHKSRLIIRWTIDGTGILPKTLRIKPLLAYRSFHALTHANDDISKEITPLNNGFSVTPYRGMPTLYVQTNQPYHISQEPCWYYNVEYQTEHMRGFPYSEDLFMPRALDIELNGVGVNYLVIGTEPCTEDPAKIWEAEAKSLYTSYPAGDNDICRSLQKAGRQFIVETQDKRTEILAGYHWFDAWGRDTLIALPGLTFASGKIKKGQTILAQIARSMKNGLVPNMFNPDGNDAYNSVDASLWYAFAVQSYLEIVPDGHSWVYEYAWPALKEIVHSFQHGPGLDIYVDNECLLHAGNENTQLTWMDAMAYGRPVTPRHGCAVELNALWYNTLAFVHELAKKFNDTSIDLMSVLEQMRKNFMLHFYIPSEGYLADVYRNNWLDKSIRPNQIFAISLPYTMVPEELQPKIFNCVKDNLLTPFGLRTLAPSDPSFKSRYEGDPNTRDLAYHQGTVWPWLLGHYTDAMIRISWAVEQAFYDLLDTITPLFGEHLLQAGIGTISEIFDAAPRYRPNGCIAQAWSVAECIRLLTRARNRAPGIYANWENKVTQQLLHPSTDTVGYGRIL
ncbi:MAG: glycogen debranching enzyme family protein, partial [Desulfovibrio sp.]|nr:glycogen debranching enzyme family protein [Desulfovibrio sp.]